MASGGDARWISVTSSTSTFGKNDAARRSADLSSAAHGPSAVGPSAPPVYQGPSGMPRALAPQQQMWHLGPQHWPSIMQNPTSVWESQDSYFMQQQFPTIQSASCPPLTSQYRPRLDAPTPTTSTTDNSAFRLSGSLRDLRNETFGEADDAQVGPGQGCDTASNQASDHNLSTPVHRVCKHHIRQSICAKKLYSWAVKCSRTFLVVLKIFVVLQWYACVSFSVIKNKCCQVQLQIILLWWASVYIRLIHRFHIPIDGPRDTIADFCRRARKAPCH